MTQYPLRVLVVDNLLPMAQQLSENLRYVGFHVTMVSDGAQTYEKAQKTMRSDYFHVAVLDLRLFDDNDPADTAGWNLAKEMQRDGKPFPPIRIIFSRRDPKYDALIHKLSEMEPSIYFTDNDPEVHSKTHERVIQKLRTVLPTVLLDTDIRFDFADNASFLSMLLRVFPRLAPDKVESHQAELEDLFRQVVAGRDYRRAHIRIMPLVKESRAWVWMTCANEHGTLRHFLAVWGEYPLVEADRDYFVRHAPASHPIAHIKHCQTLHYGINLYQLPEAIAKGWQANAWTVSRQNLTFESLRKLADNLVRLDNETVAPEKTDWSDFREQVSAQISRLAQHTRRPEFQVLHAHCPLEIDGNKWRCGNIEIPNAVDYLDEILATINTTPLRGSHGDVRIDQLLWNPNTPEYILVDYADWDDRPGSYDRASLEASLHRTVAADYLAAITMVDAAQYNSFFENSNQFTQQTEHLLFDYLQLLSAIRQDSTVRPATWKSYLRDLFEHMIYELVTLDLESAYPDRMTIQQGMHFLLLLGSLSIKLSTRLQQDMDIARRADDGFCFLDNDLENPTRVWIHGQIIRFTSDQYRILRLLFSRRGYVVPYLELAQQLHPHIEEVDDDLKNAIFAAKSRLVDDLEQLTSVRVTISNQRREGYRLTVDP